MDNRKALVTGASGFVGRRVCKALSEAGYAVTRCVRRNDVADNADTIIVPDLTRFDRWSEMLDGVNVVVHLAARTHSGSNRNVSAAAEFKALNVDASRHLAEQAARSGVGHLLFMSSIKVNGESTSAQQNESGFAPHHLPAPADLYGHSKLQAEQILTATLARSATALTVLRPPLIYGPGQKGNLLKLMRLVDRAMPLPFAALDNARSLIHVDNLASAVVAALAPVKQSNLYTLADTTVSTPALIRAMARALKVEDRLFAIPPWMLRVAAKLPGLNERLSRLCGDLVVDSSLCRTELGWRPSVSFEDGLAATAEWYRKQS